MAGDAMRTFSFEGNTLGEIHGWMQRGMGLDGIVPAIEALSALANDLERSMDSLRDALTAIGAWVGPAGEGAEGATRAGDEWVVVARPQVADSVQSADGVASGYVSTRSRVPSPAEAELTDGERSVMSAVPIIGPLLDRQAADEKLDRVTNEARQRMYDWQDTARASVSAVQPLPTVPQAAVDVAPPRPQGAPIGGTSGAGGLQVPVGAGQPGGSPPGTGGLAPGGPGVPPGGPPSSPSAPPPSGRGVVPVPPPAQGVPPSRAPGPGVPVLPVPPFGMGSSTEAGRRRAYGPGVFDAEEIARARRGAGPAGPSGVLGGAAKDGPAGRGGGPGPGDDGPNRGGSGARQASAMEPTQARGTAGRGMVGHGPIMQPAVGGAGREDDAEHSDRYAEHTDEHFVGETHRVAPPVIGG